VPRYRIGGFLERAPQADQVVVLPEAGFAQGAAIEIDQVDRLLAQQDVVRVEIRVTHTEIVKSPYASSDQDPRQNGESAFAEALRQRPDRRQPLGDEVARVSQAVVNITTRDRRRNRQAGTVQAIGELPLREGPCVVFAAP